MKLMVVLLFVAAIVVVSADPKALGYELGLEKGLGYELALEKGLGKGIGYGKFVPYGLLLPYGPYGIGLKKGVALGVGKEMGLAKGVGLGIGKELGLKYGLGGIKY